MKSDRQTLSTNSRRMRQRLFRGYDEGFPFIYDMHGKHLKRFVAAYLEARVRNVAHVNHRCARWEWALFAVGQQQSGSLEYVDCFFSMMRVSIKAIAWWHLYNAHDYFHIGAGEGLLFLIRFGWFEHWPWR